MSAEPQHLQLAAWCWIVQIATGETEECVSAWGNAVQSVHQIVTATEQADAWTRVACALSKSPS